MKGKHLGGQHKRIDLYNFLIILNSKLHIYKQTIHIERTVYTIIYTPISS